MVARVIRVTARRMDLAGKALWKLRRVLKMVWACPCNCEPLGAVHVPNDHSPRASRQTAQNPYRLLAGIREEGAKWEGEKAGASDT